ncbi:MAG: serine hydrolase [Bdellovibrionota bacterium]|nr:serine hydrolase [Bdellovibrionota bacterium]
MPKDLVLEESLKEAFLDMKLLGATSSFHLSVIKNGSLFADFSLGKVYPFYDIASLTKIVFTTTVLMKAFEDSLFQLSDPLQQFIPEFKDPKICISHLLTHSAGHRWWSDFYNQLDPGAKLKNIQYQEQWKSLRKILSSEQRENPVESFVYSDVDFFYLGILLQEIYSKDLLEIFEDYKDTWSLDKLFFNVNNETSLNPSNFAPTEDSDYLGRIIQGEVHDENCHALGGVSSHAGLFSDSQALIQWLSEIRKAYQGESSLLMAETIKLFGARQTDEKFGDWGYGFMKPSKGTASCGKYFSDQSFGHTGFTGTSIWYDPAQDLGVIILSNRVHPTRENKTFVGMRSLIHNKIVESIEN